MENIKERLGEILEEDHKERTSLFSCLYFIQDEQGFISEKDVSCLAKELNLSEIDIYGVITFYSMFNLKKQGKNIIRVCVSLPCYLNHSEKIFAVIEEILGIKDGETTSDGRFTLEGVSCLGLCDEAPAIMVNKEVYGKLTKDKIKKILEQYEEVK